MSEVSDADIDVDGDAKRARARSLTAEYLEIGKDGGQEDGSDSDSDKDGDEGNASLTWTKSSGGGAVEKKKKRSSSSSNSSNTNTSNSSSEKGHAAVARVSLGSESGKSRKQRGFSLWEKEEHEEYPGVFYRILNVVPVVELLGFLKDHRWEFKEHWVNACNHNSTRLKSGLTFLFEMEVLVGALFLGLTSSTYFQAIDDDMVSAFSNVEAGKLDFWVILFGLLAMEFQLMFAILAYVCIVTMQPVSVANFYTWVRTPVQLWLMFIPNLMLISMFYLTLIFFVLLFISKSGAKLISVIVVLLPFVTVIPVCLVLIGYSLNLAQLSGCYSSARVIAEDKLEELSPAETEKMLYYRAKQGQKDLQKEGVSVLDWYRGKENELNDTFENEVYDEYEDDRIKDKEGKEENEKPDGSSLSRSKGILFM